MADTPKQDADAALDRAATQSGRDGRPGALPIQDPLRHDVWPQCQYVRLHAARGSELRRDPLDDDSFNLQRTHENEGQAGAVFTVLRKAASARRLRRTGGGMQPAAT